ncbi:MAG TPA: hypothetical protein PLP17_12095 [Oligoflexia bacterium]|nr:hypothetical protein [Oligoflexia bacterium]
MDEQGSNAPAKPGFGIGTIIKHAHLGRGRVIGYDGPLYVVQFRGELKRIPFTYREMEAVELVDVETAKIKQVIAELLGDYGWLDVELELGSRWVGGTMKLVPGKEGTQPKEIPLEAFFKKVINVREKLRVLEQKINNHPKLEQEEKLELEGYITRCYGSLTSFNVLFADKPSQFKGEGTA